MQINRVDQEGKMRVEGSRGEWEESRVAKSEKYRLGQDKSGQDWRRDTTERHPTQIGEKGKKEEQKDGDLGTGTVAAK